MPWLIALLLMLAIGAVDAAELPILTVKCLHPEGHAICREMDDQMKQKVAAMKIDPRLMKFCAAKAEYRENGYFGLWSCIREETSAQKVRTLVVGLDDAGYCDRVSGDPKRPNGMAVFQLCVSEQKRSLAHLAETIADYPDAQIVRCVAKVKAAGLGSSLIQSCLDDQR